MWQTASQHPKTQRGRQPLGGLPCTCLAALRVVWFFVHSNGDPIAAQLPERLCLGKKTWVNLGRGTGKKTTPGVIKAERLDHTMPHDMPGRRENVRPNDEKPSYNATRCNQTGLFFPRGRVPSDPNARSERWGEPNRVAPTIRGREDNWPMVKGVSS